MEMGKLNHITTFVFDIDGVITDGMLLVGDDGSWQRSMNVKDGYAIKKAIDAGFNIAIISGANQTGMVNRLNYLGIESVFHGVKDKVAVFNEYINKNQLNTEEVLFMGDDLPDLELLKIVGVSSCPSDAVDEVKETVDFISKYEGGKTCVREVIESVLKLQRKW